MKKRLFKKTDTAGTPVGHNNQKGDFRRRFYAIANQQKKQKVEMKTLANQNVRLQDQATESYRRSGKW